MAYSMAIGQSHRSGHEGNAVQRHARAFKCQNVIIPYPSSAQTCPAYVLSGLVSGTTQNVLFYNHVISLVLRHKHTAFPYRYLCNEILGRCRFCVWGVAPVDLFVRFSAAEQAVGSRIE